VIVGGSDMESGFVKKTEVYSAAKPEKGSEANAAATDSAAVTEPSLKEQLSQLKSAEPDDYAKIIDSILDQDVKRKDLLRSLSRSSIKPAPSKERTDKVKKGWSKWEATDNNGVTRPYQVYAPEEVVSGKRPTAVVVHLHGAVARPDFGESTGGADSVGYAGFLWPKVADANNVLIVCPQGRADCCWWLDAGVDHVKAVIREVKRTFAVPDQSIFCSGFSDGASGCYYLSMVSPDPFAGFLAMNGHPAVASSASKKQIYLSNMRHTPFIAAMTQNDSLYPTKSLLPHLNLAIKQGAPIWLISYANANHQPTYFDDQTTTFVNFLKKTKRERNRSRIRWQTAGSETGKVDWLEIIEIGESKWQAPEWEKLNLMTEPGRISLGIELASFASAEVKRVVDDSGASSAGIKAGDTIVQLGEVKISGARDLRTALGKFKFGQEFTCVVKRGEEELDLKGTLPEFVSEPHYLREKSTAQVDCVLSSEGKPRILFSSRNVKRARVWLHKDFQAADEIEVIYGFGEDTETKMLPIVRLSNKQLLERFAQNAERTAVDRYVDVKID